MDQIYTWTSTGSASVTSPLVSVPWAWTQREGCVRFKIEHLNIRASITHVLPLQGVNSRAAGASGSILPS